jgi:hypothetical protein
MSGAAPAAFSFVVVHHHHFVVIIVIIAPRFHVGRARPHAT